MSAQTSATGGRSNPDTELRIRAIDIKKTFTRAGGEVVNAVADISLEVAAGRMLVLLGPSGCGKTTLLRCIAGLERPDGGEIHANGKLVYSKTRNVDVPPEGRNLGMMFQSYAVWPHMTVAENVAFPLVSHRRPKAEIADRVQRALARVGIPNLGDQYPNRLSGGQQQRVALARSLVIDPKVVLFDEPLSNVDAKVREELRAELAAQQAENGFSGVYVTHDQIEALQLADQIAVLQEGHVAQLGTPEEVYGRPASRYVANFVGRVNEFGATLTRIESGVAIGDSAQGPVRGRLMSGDPKPGDAITALVRPEYLELVPAGDATRPNHFTGELVTSLFAGAYREHLVRIGDQLVRVTQMGDVGRLTVRDGDRVTLRADAEHVFVYVD